MPQFVKCFCPLYIYDYLQAMGTRVIPSPMLLQRTHRRNRNALARCVGARMDGISTTMHARDEERDTPRRLTTTIETVSCTGNNSAFDKSYNDFSRNSLSPKVNVCLHDADMIRICIFAFGMLNMDYRRNYC